MNAKLFISKNQKNYQNSRSLTTKIASVFCVFSLALIVQSCYSEPKNYNQVFEDKYRKDVEKITAQRKTENKDSEPKIPQAFTSEVTNSNSSEIKYYPYANIAKLGDSFSQDFLPNGETYQQTRNANPSNSLPQDMFEISYNTQSHPPFNWNSSPFDFVRIPKKDGFGVETQLQKKDYLMAGNNNLMRSIDTVIKGSSAENIELSQILISEQKQQKRQEKLNKIFGLNQDKNSDKITKTNY